MDPNITAGDHLSYWLDSIEPIQFGKPDQNLSTDVVIVGAGISGLSVAYNCLLKGKTVVIVDDGNVGSGETGRTTAHVVNAIDDRYYEIERIFGEEGARLAAGSHTEAINFIERISAENNVDCDFERLDGYLFLHPSDKDESMDREFEAAKKAGVDVERLEETPGIKNQQKNCIRFKSQAQFHPLKYLKGLSELIVQKGGKIFTQTRAAKITDKGIETGDGFTIDAQSIVVATNSPVNNKYVMHLKQYAYRTYVIGATVKKGAVQKALWWDTGDFEANSELAPYHYVRTQPYNETHDLLIVGGEDHAVALPEAIETTEEASYSKLIGWTRARFDIIDVVYKWSGQVMEPMDCLGYIGKNPMDSDNVYIVTGDSGNGITHGTIAGILISDLIAGIDNPWQKIYDPARLHIFKSGKTFIKEFFGGMIQYLKNSSKDTSEIKLADIQPGDATIIKLGREKYGAYRDEEENLHVVSATCTHLGCTVRWNSDEKSWDCPCHGSRYSYAGQVLNGPANENLVYFMENAGAAVNNKA